VVPADAEQWSTLCRVGGGSCDHFVIGRRFRDRHVPEIFEKNVAPDLEATFGGHVAELLVSLPRTTN
jgi:hypothetical protein